MIGNILLQVTLPELCVLIRREILVREQHIIRELKDKNKANFVLFYVEDYILYIPTLQRKGRR